MRVLLLMADRGGCGLYRCVMPARIIGRSVPSTEVELFIAHGVRGKTVRNADGRLECLQVENPNVDVVVYQRPTSEELMSTIPRMKEHGCTIVVELDDDIAAVPPSNWAYDFVHPKRSPEHNWHWLQAACREADWMTCTEPSIGERYMPGRYTVVPNYVPASMLTLNGHAQGVPVVGWSGTIRVHGNDLEVTRGAVARAVEDNGAAFHVVGTDEGVQAALGLSYPPTSTGWLELKDYPQALANLTIGIVPLEGNLFNNGKSWLKGLEYAALGIPFVASPTPAYQRLHEMGVGILARRPRDWYRAISRLVQDEQYRSEVAARGKQVVREQLTLEDNMHQWIDAWKQAVRSAHGAATLVG